MYKNIKYVWQRNKVHGDSILVGELVKSRVNCYDRKYGKRSLLNATVLFNTKDRHSIIGVNKISYAEVWLWNSNSPEPDEVYDTLEELMQNHFGEMLQ